MISDFAQADQQHFSQHEFVIVDQSTNNPVPGVSVDVINIDSAAEQVLATFISDENGRIQINAEFSYDVELVLTHSDYLRKERILHLNNPDFNQLAIVRKTPVRVAGKVFDSETGETIPQAIIEVISSNEKVNTDSRIVTVSNADGEFDFSFQFTIPLELQLSHISYAEKSVEIDNAESLSNEIFLDQRVFEGEEVVVVSTLVNREQMRETTTIDRVSATQIQQVASFDAFDLVSTLRGVDIATQSMNLQTISTRGFNTGANSRFLQLTDGVDSQAPGLGFPVGNLLGPVELDVSSMELVAGPASSRYGSSAMTGVLQTISKDPFQESGFSFNAKTGVHGLRISGQTAWNAEGNGLYDISARMAHLVGEKLAVKITGNMIEGTDWIANNYDNIGWGGPFENYDSTPPNPGFNGVNIYGDENFVYLPVGSDENVGAGNLIPVTRTGYREEDLVNYNVTTRKLSGSVYYRFTPEYEFNIEGRYGYTNTLYTADSRIRLEDFEVYQLKSEIVSDLFYLRGYTTMQYSGNSYDVVQLATNLLEHAKSDEDWYRDFRIAYERGWPVLSIPPGNLDRARSFADSGVTLIRDHEAAERYEPGTTKFENQAQLLKSTYGYEGGAGIKDNSQLYHAESGYSLVNLPNGFEAEIGGDVRYYRLDSAGTIFPDTTSNEITNYQFGGFASIEKSYREESLNLNGSLRFDKNENFSMRFSPQVGIGYVADDSHFFRLSYQYGFRFPTVREQFLNQNIGNARILGGLEDIHGHYRLHNNSISYHALTEFNKSVAHDMNADSFNRDQAEIRNLHILERGIVNENNLKPIRTETTHALEIGYRKLFTPFFYFDLNYYVNFYRDFIGLHRMVKPRVSPSTDLYTASGQLNNSIESDQYYVNTNASGLVSIHGFSFDIKYQSGAFFTGLNGDFTRLIQSSDDPVMPGFNTPPFKLNFEWGNRRIAEHVGFKMVYRLRTSHDWESPFMSGRIETYGHFDFQVNVRIPQINSMIKTGFTNMGINDYYNVYGGPKIGSIVFATFSFNPALF